MLVELAFHFFATGLSHGPAVDRLHLHHRNHLRREVPRIRYVAEKSVLTILNNFAASRNIGRDQWLCHGGGFEERSRRAFAIGRENDAIGLGDEWPNIIRGPEVLNDTF